MNSSNSYFNFVIMWQRSKISAMYFMDKDSKLSNLFQQASSPTTGTAPRSQSRLSVCPSTQDICRSTTLHDLSEDELEHATPVMVLAPSNRESGKKQVKRRFRRKREPGDYGEHTEKQGKGKDCKLHPKPARSSWNASDSSSSSDESQWAQARRRAREKARMPRRGRRNNRSCSNQDESSNNNAVELVTLGTVGKKNQEVSDPENPALNHRRRRVPRLKESQSSASSQEARISSRKCGKSKGKNYYRDQRPMSFPRHDKVSKDSFAEAGSGSDALAVPDNGGPAGAGSGVTDAVQKPPVLYDDWSDDLEVCRLVPNKKDLTFLRGISHHHGLSALLLTAFCHCFSIINC
uniref:Uncharacterized protein n=1 Tax=Accipiter nisus TaxID=211598 RepID=A0A8B9M073_9AVES